MGGSWGCSWVAWLQRQDCTVVPVITASGRSSQQNRGDSACRLPLCMLSAVVGMPGLLKALALPWLHGAMKPDRGTSPRLGVVEKRSVGLAATRLFSLPRCVAGVVCVSVLAVSASACLVYVTQWLALGLPSPCFRDSPVLHVGPTHHVSRTILICSGGRLVLCL